MLDDLTSMGEQVRDLESTLFGPLVKVVRTLYTGDQVTEEMPASLAVDALMRDPLNGSGEVISAHILWPQDVVDVWGCSM